VLVAGNRETGGAGNLISLSRWSIFALVKPVLRIMAGRGVWMGGNIFQVDNLLNARPELGRELICGRPARCKRFLKKIGT